MHIVCTDRHKIGTYRYLAKEWKFFPTPKELGTLELGTLELLVIIFHPFLYINSVNMTAITHNQINSFQLTQYIVVYISLA